MKRLMALILAILLLAGCAGESLTVEVLAQDRDFGSFRVSPPAPADAKRTEALLRDALGQYPPGFSAQWGRVEILLVGSLTGEAQFAGGRFAGFTQRTDTGWLMVLDAERCDTGTVHHEIAHILDGILTDAGALTEDEWMAFCPSSFSYGSGDFEAYPDFFTDEYAMENIKEDRACTFEAAMLCGAGVYENSPALWLKLEYFSRAIRAHFDTTGWPAKTAWEQALE